MNDIRKDMCDRLTRRRKILRQRMGKDVILFSGSSYMPRNYAANTHPFHQDSTFLYYADVRLSDAYLLGDSDGEWTLYLDESYFEDSIWTGPPESVENLRARTGIARVKNARLLKEDLRQFDDIRHIAPYDPATLLRLAKLFDCSPDECLERSSQELASAVFEQRAYKDAFEVAEIERAIEISQTMLESAQKVIAPGVRESEVMAALSGPVLALERQMAFPPIVTVQGQILHNEEMSNILRDGQILLIDSGCESEYGYCGDITRCFPVNGRWTQKQKDIYDLVLSMQTDCIEKSAETGVSNLDLHLLACRTLTDGLIDLGLMKGNRQDAFESRAYRLFMPHGIGHMLGLDVHDMENFGQIVKYAPDERKDKPGDQATLRLCRRLEPGFVITIEPGIYFNKRFFEKPTLKDEYEAFVCLDKVAEYFDFGGIRIEDDILIEENGSRVLGPGIPK